jgi:hypothetical protein
MVCALRDPSTIIFSRSWRREESLIIAQSDEWCEGAAHSHIAGGVDFSKSAATLNEKKIKQDVQAGSGLALVSKGFPLSKNKVSIITSLEQATMLTTPPLPVKFLLWRV